MTRAVPEPGQWVTVRGPGGKPIMVTTKYEGDRRLVIVKPIRDER